MNIFLELEMIKLHGLEVWAVKANGQVIRTYMSEAKAREFIMRALNSKTK